MGADDKLTDASLNAAFAETVDPSMRRVRVLLNSATLFTLFKHFRRRKTDAR